MGKPINVSSGNYSRLDAMRRLIPGKKAYESFNVVISRLLNHFEDLPKTTGDTNEIRSDIHTEAEKD